MSRSSKLLLLLEHLEGALVRHNTQLHGRSYDVAAAVASVPFLMCSRRATSGC